jgi:hypothetical protein
MPNPKKDRNVLQTFADAVTWCESQEHLACCGGNGLELHIHHVLGGPHRIDAKWNLVRLCPAAHEWCHNRPQAGRVLCWHILDSRGMFDPVTIRDRWRQCPLAYIERVLPQIAEDWVRELGERLLERHQ